MGVVSISLLILFGILLLLLELLVIPGKIVAALVGLGLIAWGLSSAYMEYGSAVGHYILLATVIVIGSAIVFALKSGTWSRLMLKTKISSKANETQIKENVAVGDVGKTVSRLAPMGTIIINGNYYEAKAYNTFIDQDSEIEVIKVTFNSIFVKLKNE